MISWKELISYIEKLQELPNGGGTEVFFCYGGTEYCIVSYKGKCDIQKCMGPTFDGETMKYPVVKPFEYKSLTELGKAKDIGFSVEECWDRMKGFYSEPDFEYFTFEEIYNGYKEAYEKKQGKGKSEP